MIIELFICFSKEINPNAYIRHCSILVSIWYSEDLFLRALSG